MTEKREPMFIGPDRIMNDCGVSKAKAYEMIKELNKDLKEEYPKALIISEKVNRIWYEEACLIQHPGEG